MELLHPELMQGGAGVGAGAGAGAGFAAGTTQSLLPPVAPSPHSADSTRSLSQVHTSVEIVAGDALSKPTMVLLHGYAAGNAFWSFNLDTLAKDFNVYAVDWPGCGASDRPHFGVPRREALRAEDWFVDGFEAWRQAHPHRDTTLRRFVLVGHSLGAMISARLVWVAKRA